jgi:hypothetical protein
MRLPVGLVTSGGGCNRTTSGEAVRPSLIHAEERARQADETGNSRATTDQKVGGSNPSERARESLSDLRRHTDRPRNIPARGPSLRSQISHKYT